MDEVTAEIAAPAERLYVMVSDVTNMGRWSPECHRCEWLDGASGPAAGARFKGWNKRGLMRWSTVSKVVVADAPTQFEWEVEQSRMRWGYRFEPRNGITRVTEYREEIRTKPLYVRIAYKLRLLGKDPDAIVLDGMKQTLARLKAAAEA
jgi:hypothetical protein